MIVIDDPIKPADGLSETKRKSVNNWYSNTAYTRLDNKKEGCIIIVMQRIHVEDLVGHVLEKEEWRHINLPATAIKNEHHILRHPNRRLYIFKRKAGDLLHPEREPKHILQNLRKTLGEYEYSSQYQQMPAPPGGGIIKFKWFKQYKELPVEKPMRILQSWDTASKVDDHNDFSVCTTRYQYENAYYLVDMYREKLEFPQLYGAVRQQYERHKPSIVVIEDKNSGVHLIQQLRQDICIPVKPNNPKTDKATRAMAMTPQIEAGNVFIPSGARWLPDFKLEVIHFPKGKHDDQIDSVTQALEYFADYLKLGSVVDLKEALDNEGITSPIRLTAKGNARGGKPFSRGALHHMLRNPIYNGKIRHKDETFDGQHTALIEDDLWQAVQSKLDAQAAFRQGEVKKVKSKALLKGLIYTPEGILYTPTRTKKGKASYRYYTSQELLNKRDHPSAALGRLPAHEVEKHLLKGLRKELTKDEALYAWLGLDPMMDKDTAQHIQKHIEVLGEGLVKCLKRVEVHSKKLVATVSIASYAQLIGQRLDVNVEAMVEEAQVCISYYVRRAYKGTVVIKPTGKTAQTLDSLPQVQLQNLVRGIVWRDEHFAGMTIKAIAKREGLSEAGIRKIIMGSFDQLASLYSQ